MNIKDYCNLVEGSRAKLRNKDVDNVHMIFGLFTELGELVDGFKKDMAYNVPIDDVNLKEEIGDLMWYIAGLCNVNGFDLDNILEANIAKLKTRYPDKFTEEAAINRDLDKERSVLMQATGTLITNKEMEDIIRNFSDIKYTGGPIPANNPEGNNNGN
jgi:NTP pyrophosphatase (non-canonical NTP hydrolase)